MSFFDEAAHIIFEVAGFFIDKSIQVRDVWILGPHLGDFLQNVGLRLIDFSFAVRDAGDAVQRAIDSISFGIDLSWIIDALSRQIEFGWLLFQDARGWVENHVLALVRDGWDFLHQPARWVADRLYEWQPLLRSLIDDARGWLRSHIAAIIEMGSDFLNNPGFWVESMLGRRFPEVRSLFLNPSQWLHGHLLGILPEANLLLSAPAGWVKNRLRELFPSAPKLLEDPAGYVIDVVRLRFQELLLDVRDLLFDAVSQVLEERW